MDQLGAISFGQALKKVNSVVIAVMGMTGSGKSTFIQKATGTSAAIVGDGLSSCTQRPQFYEFSHAGRTIILIDTPGFDDTFRTDADVLQDVAACLELTYKHDMRLSGIVYLHRIIDPRMTHGGMRNLAMFRKLCGTDPLHNVILATSFWGEVNQVRGEQREAELRTNPDYWAGMMAKGSRMRRFENTQDSALMIINELASKATVALDIQKEMCDQGLALVDTAAGEALDHELAEMTKKYAKDMEKLQQEIRDAKEHDKELQDALKKQALRVEKTIDEMHAQQEILKADRRNELRAMEQEFDRRLRRMETESQEGAEWRLKAAVEKARLEEQNGHLQQASQTQIDYYKAKMKREKVVKIFKIGGAIASTALTTAACIFNPMMAGSAVSSFVTLANSFFSDDISGVTSAPDASGFVSDPE